MSGASVSSTVLKKLVLETGAADARAGGGFDLASEATGEVGSAVSGDAALAALMAI